MSKNKIVHFACIDREIYIHMKSFQKSFSQGDFSVFCCPSELLNLQPRENDSFRVVFLNFSCRRIQCFVTVYSIRISLPMNGNCNFLFFPSATMFGFEYFKMISNLTYKCKVCNKILQ